MSARRLWSEVELQLLRESYADSRTDDIAQALGRPVGQVYQAADRHGLKKSAEYMASEAACRLRQGGDVGAAHRFAKGQQPWNKGASYVAGGRSAETRFKAGQVGTTRAPIGSERVSKDGYLERKVAEWFGSPRNWKAVHVIEWEEANGPVPQGHAIVFKSADKRIALDNNLECISRAELMRRNTVHNWPKPLAQLVQLRGALNRQINRRAKEADPK